MQLVRLLTGDGPLTFIQKSLSLGPNHIRTFLGRPQDVGRTCPLELRIRPNEDVLIKYAGDVLKMLVEDVLSPFRLQDSTLGRPKDAGRGRAQDVGRERPLALHGGPY